MATYYAAHNGTTGGAGTSPDPWNITRATATSGYSPLAGNGDTVILKDGTYQERMVIAAAGVTFQAQNEGAALFDGKYYPSIVNKNIFDPDTKKIRTGLPYVVAGKYDSLVEIQANSVTLDGIEVRNVAGRGIECSGDNCVIKNCRVDYCYNALLNTENTTGLLVEDCVLTRGGIVYYAYCDRGIGTWPGSAKECPNSVGGGQAGVPTCVSLSSCDAATVRGCEVAYCWGEGLGVWRGSTNCVLEENIAHNNYHVNFYNNGSSGCTWRRNVAWSGQIGKYYYNQKPRECMAIGDEVSQGFSSSGLSIYNNLFIGGHTCFQVRNGQPDYNTRLYQCYIAHNTFVALGDNGVGNPVSNNIIVIDPANTGNAHAQSLFENNVFLRVGSAALGNMANGDPTGITFRNNYWSRTGGTAANSTPPAKFRGTNDEYGPDVKLVNPISPVDDDIVGGEPSWSMTPGNYNLKTDSPAKNSSSDGSAVTGVTIINVTNDYLGASRPVTKTQRDMGAFEQGGIISDPGDVSVSVAVTPSTSGAAPLTVTATVTASTTQGTLARWVYDWGDGSPARSMTVATAQNYVYQTPGSYTLRVTVVNSNDATGEDTEAITVSADTSAPVVIDVTVDTMPTDTSTKDIVWSLSDKTPKAAIFLMTLADGLDSEDAGALASIGLWANNGGDGVEAVRLNDNTARPHEGYGYRILGTSVLEIPSSGLLSAAGVRKVTNPRANTVTLAVPDTNDPWVPIGGGAFSAAFRLVSIAFSGADVTAARRLVTFAGDLDTARMTVADADLIFVMTANHSEGDTDDVLLSFGIGTKTDSWAMLWYEGVMLAQNRIALRSTSGQAAAIEAWDTEGITFRRYGTWIDSFQVLALKLGANRADLSAIQTPVTTTATDYTTDADPDFLMLLMNRLSNSGHSWTLGGSAGVYVTDGTDDYSATWRSVYDADPTDSGSYVASNLRLPNELNAPVVEGAVTLGTLKWTMTPTTTSTTARMWPALAIAATSAPSGPVADFSADKTVALTGEDVTFTLRNSLGGATLNTWSIEYGDGESDTFTSATTQAVHAYTLPGFKTVTLKIYTTGGDDTEVKASYIRVNAQGANLGLIYGPFQPQPVTNQSKTYIGDVIDQPLPGLISMGLDLDALLIDDTGPGDGMTGVAGKIKLAFDPVTQYLKLVRPNGAYAVIPLTWSDAEPDPGGGTVIVKITSGTDDGLEDTDGSITLTTTTISMTSATRTCGLLFRNVQVPRAANITSANLEVYIGSSGLDDPIIDWYAEKIGNAPGLSTDTNDITNRTKTTAKVSQSATNLGLGAWHVMADMKLVVKEVVAQGSWTIGNNLLVIGDGMPGGTSCQFRTYDHSGDTYAAKITIVYTT